MRESSVQPYCKFPWSAITVHPNGNVTSCRVIRQHKNEFVLGNLKNQNFEEIWTGSQAQNIRREHLVKDFNFSGCDLCVQVAEQGEISRRDEINNLYGSVYSQLETNYSEVIRPKDIIYLDIAFSSTCNSSCVMCSSAYSTSWLKMDQKLKEHNFDSHSVPTRKQGYENYIENFSSIFPYLKNLNQIFLKGGEPFFKNKECIWFLNKLVEEGLAEQVTLSIVTNGTVYNEKIVSLFKYFKRVEIIVSLDAVGELYQYIRGGDEVTSEMVVENIKKFKESSNNVWTVISPTLQAYNVLRFYELIQYSLPIADEVIYNNWVQDPYYQSIASIPDDLIPLAVENLEKCIHFLETEHPENKSIYDLKYSRDYLKENIPWLKIHQNPVKMKSEFVRYTKFINAERNMSLCKIIPEFQGYIE